MVLMLDLLAITVLVFCAWRGKTKGFVLTAFGLLAVVVALVGASFLSSILSKPVGALIEPLVLEYLQQLAEELPEFSDLQLSLSNSLSGSESQVLLEIESILSSALTALKDSALLSHLTNSLNSAVSDGTLVVLSSAAASIAAFLSQQLARAILFFIFFILILIAWWLLSRVVDLAFQLPLLRGVNEFGGLLLGLIKGALFLLVSCWALISLGIIHTDIISQTYLLSLFLNFHII